MKDRRKNREIPPPPKVDAWDVVTFMGLLILSVAVIGVIVK